jgi:O-acetyl-ADP-ribose deacetylase (regulator of RNase III)
VAYGEAVVTPAGKLKAKHLVHAVGPIAKKDSTGQAHVLKSAIVNALTKAAELSATSVALPPISTGIYMYPKKEAAIVTYDAIADYLRSNTETSIKQLRLVIKDMATLGVFTKEFGKRYPEDLPRIKLE